MVFHVGLSSDTQTVFAYNAETKETKKFDTVEDLLATKVPIIDKIFEEISTELTPTAKIGSVCVAVNSQFDDDARKLIKAIGEKYGFGHIEVIDYSASDFFASMVQVPSETTFKDGDILWMDTKYKNEYQKQDNKFVLTGPREVNRNRGPLGKPPNYIVYFEHDYKPANELRYVFRDSEQIEVKRENYNIEKGALVKARIAAGDPEVVKYDMVVPQK